MGTQATSIAARPTESKAAKLREKVYARLLELGALGATDDELIEHFSTHGANSIRPRRVDLVRAGRVMKSRMRRPTVTGAPAIVWVAIERKAVAA